MCTLTYLLNDNGYELFFNRDEQRSRVLATPPQYDEIKEALYPIDPQGGGTWIAVNKRGLSLALLNNYQAAESLTSTNYNSISRGQLILSLIAGEGSVTKQLKWMDLSVYQPFQLCIFSEDLSIHNQEISCVKWDGIQLIDVSSDVDLPITSSSVDFIEVSQKRKDRFERLVDGDEPLSTQLKDFHFSTEANGKHSVNMQREDAKTVSISHISINSDRKKNSHSSINNVISFEYFDNVMNENHVITR